MWSRYCLILEGNEEEWRFLGIIPISYRKTESGKHSMLIDAIASWEDSVPRPNVKHQDKVEEILSGAPTLILKKTIMFTRSC